MNRTAATEMFTHQMGLCYTNSHIFKPDIHSQQNKTTIYVTNRIASILITNSSLMTNRANSYIRLSDGGCWWFNYNQMKPQYAFNCFC